MTSVLDIAKKYVKKGFSVVPIPYKGKAPSIPWKEYQTRFPTDAELESWFSNNRTNIGIVTGKISGITVVDVDVKSGGLETLKTLGLPMTWVAKTGGGGWHYFYRYAPTIGQTTAIYKGIDIRNDGGQVVAAPSCHQSGNNYEWTYTEGELVAFPIDLFEQKQIVKKDWKDIFDGTNTGSRNNNASIVFGKLMTTFRPTEWESVVWPLGQSWNQKNIPPLPERELRLVFESIGKRAAGNPQAPTEAELDKKLNGRRTPTFKENIIKRSKEARTFFDWGTPNLNNNFPILENGTYTVFFGQQGSGKTTYLLHLAKVNSKNHRVAFLSTEMSREKIIELYCIKKAGITDEEYRTGKANIEKAVEENIDDLKEIDFIGVDDSTIFQEYAIEEIQKIIDRNKPELLIIDNLDKITAKGKSELDISKAVSAGVLQCARSNNIAIILIHHANKQTEQKKKNPSLYKMRGLSGFRGTNKIADDADILIEIGGLNDKDYENAGEELRRTSQLRAYKDRNFRRTGKVQVQFVNGVFTDYVEAFEGLNEAMRNIHY